MSDLSPDDSVRISMFPVILAIVTACLTAVAYVWRLFVKERMASRDIEHTKKLQDLDKDINIRISAQSARTSESLKSLYDRLTNIEKSLTKTESDLEKEVALWRLTEKGIVEQIDKLESLYEKLNGKIDAQGEILLKIYGEVSRGSQN